VSTRIVSIDPGGTTGIVWGMFDLEGGLASHEVVKAARRSGHFGVANINCRDVLVGFYNLCLYVDQRTPDVVLMEGFQLWTQNADLTPVQLLALAEWEFNQGRLATGNLVIQMPGERNVVRDDQLHKWGLWNAGMKDVNSAMKHLIVYIRKHQRPVVSEEGWE